MARSSKRALALESIRCEVAAGSESMAWRIYFETRGVSMAAFKEAWADGMRRRTFFAAKAAREGMQPCRCGLKIGEGPHRLACPLSLSRA